ncbi:hypothetical protein H6F75_16415 [Nodosilinea sp. FACHB-131]|uniref:hypothetical protein n=1 Tax=Cyanophyceae TaxID=3028117 RepID=UPI00168500EF|nr:hypothetical protein [Nodosilinea sp. FACHB-131]MBD1875070.1 hypothetical protein [Nodosilinea sp. FACHB-131]
MGFSRQEIEEELEHKRQILRALIRRRRPLELQVAQRGLSTPPEIFTEISTLSEQIHIQEDEMARLETLAAEGQISIVEAEYKVMVAKAWDTQRGKPTLTGSAELELLRLRMGIVPEKAYQIENEIRVGLAEEAFSNLDTDFFERLPVKPEPKRIEAQKVYEPTSEYNNSGRDQISNIIQGEIHISSLSISHSRFFPGSDDPFEGSLRVIGRSIRLDHLTALRLFLVVLPPIYRLDIEEFGKQLIRANRVWNYQADREVFDYFLNNLASELENQESVICVEDV